MIAAGDSRKIVQLVGTDKGIHALCDDGSVWWLDDLHGNLSWVRVPCIPINL